MVLNERLPRENGEKITLNIIITVMTPTATLAANTHLTVCARFCGHYCIHVILLNSQNNPIK